MVGRHVARYHREALRQAPVGDGNHRRTRGCDRRTHAGNHVDGDARANAFIELFAPAAEHESVAPPEPDHRLARERMLDEMSVDLALLHPAPAGR
jgi:hypothetical protein